MSKLAALMHRVMRVQIECELLGYDLVMCDEWHDEDDGSAELCLQLVNDIDEHLLYIRKELSEELTGYRIRARGEGGAE